MESSTETWAMGTAGVVTGAEAVRPAGVAASATEPQAWHSEHRPTHLAVSQPHSVQRNPGRGGLGMRRTLDHRADSGAERAGARCRTLDGPLVMMYWIDQAHLTTTQQRGAGMSRILGRIPSPPPTLADVAERAGVSRQTVSNALNNPDLLRADTLERVQEAISDLDYSPNRAARSLRTRTSHLIGLRIGPAPEGTANALMDRFVHSLVETSREAGYHVLLVAGDAEDPVAGYDDLLRSTAVDAFVVTDTFLGNPQAAWLESRRAPFVAFGRPWDNPEATHPWVDVDGAAGSELAATHLLERGHSRIAWIGWRKDSWIGEDRRAGWSRALRSRGLPTTGLASRVEDTVASGREASAVLLDEAQPSAFVCASDTLAMGVLHTLAERGLTPGRDIAVVGFDDSQVAQVAPPGLTSVRQPLEDVAVEIVKALEGLLGHPPFVGPGVLLTPTLAVRGTS